MIIVALIALAYAVAASFMDYRYKVVPNDLTLVAAACALALAFSKGANLVEFALFGLLWLCFSYLLYAARVWGAGDAKFFAVLSLYAFLLKGGASVDGVLYWFLASAGLLLAFALLANANEVMRLLAREWRKRALRAGRKAFDSVAFVSCLAFLSGFTPSPLVLFAFAILLWFLSVPFAVTAILFVLGVWHSIQGVLLWLGVYAIGFAGLEFFSILREIAKSKRGRFKGSLAFAPFASLAFAYWVLLA
jgi:Flp pilus assembly protein protease CpaA